MFAGSVHVKDYSKNHTESRENISEKCYSWGISCDSNEYTKDS